MTPPLITLRPFDEGDSAFFAGMASDERVTRFIGNGKPWRRQTIQVRIQEALQRKPLDNLGASRWFLAEDEGEAVGIVVSTRREAGIEIGYWVLPEYWGRGIAGAMVDEALATLPKEYGTQKFLARVDPANGASAKLLAGRGFRRESQHQGLDCYVLAQHPIPPGKARGGIHRSRRG